MKFTILKEFMDHLTETLVPGNSVSVYYKDEEVYRYSSGYADLENKVKMKGDELLYIYSCSKVTTVIAALQLLERGKYLLSDPLYEYIPEYRDMYIKNVNGDPVKANKPITIYNLFTMTAGLNYNNSDKAAYIKKAREITNGAMDTVVVAKCLADELLDFEPGVRWQYSMCHDVLAAFVEVVSGKKFRDYVKENIFDPIGMEAYYGCTPEIKDRMACQYVHKANSEEFDAVKAQAFGNDKTGHIENAGKQNSHILGDRYDSGGAGIITSVPDYAKLANTLANFGKAQNGEQIVSRGTIELLRTNQLTDEQMKYFSWKQLSGYGYGLGVRTCMDKTKASSIGSPGELGWGGAAGATILADPNRQFSFFYSHHMLNPHEEYYQPRIRNAAYACID